MTERFDFSHENENFEKTERSNQRNLVPTDKPDFELEQAAGQKETDASRGVWVDTGIHNIPINKIDLSDSYVNGPEDFQHVPYSEMVRGVRILENEVRPAVEQGADNEHFRELDQQRGVDYAHGTQRVYETFYGGEPIKLNKIGDRYVIDGGYHRLYVAKELRLDSIPARVLERRL